MKKQQVRALNQLAEMLPRSVTIEIKADVIKGDKLSDEQIDLVKTDVCPERYYKFKNHQFADIIHINRLKKAYARNKEQGIADYITWLDANNKKMNVIIEELGTLEEARLKQVDEELMAIAKKGGKGFWSSLMTFLFAFAQIFTKSKKAA